MTPVLLLGGTTFAALASATAATIAASATSSEAAPWLAGGMVGSGAIATVVWVARKSVNGELVPLPIKDLLESTREQNKALVSQNAQLTTLVERLSNSQEKNTEALFGVRDYLLRHDDTPPRKPPLPTPGSIT